MDTVPYHLQAVGCTGNLLLKEEECNDSKFRWIQKCINCIYQVCTLLLNQLATKVKPPTMYRPYLKHAPMLYVDVIECTRYLYSMYPSI